MYARSGFQRIFHHVDNGAVTAELLPLRRTIFDLHNTFCSRLGWLFFLDYMKAAYIGVCNGRVFTWYTAFVLDRSLWEEYQEFSEGGKYPYFHFNTVPKGLIKHG